MSLLFRCLTSTNNPDDSFGLFREDDDQSSTFGRVADYQFACFLFRMGVIVKQDCERVIKNRGRFVERNAMFCDIVYCLLIIPFKP
jgi:hypothetical protein